MKASRNIFGFLLILGMISSVFAAFPVPNPFSTKRGDLKIKISNCPSSAYPGKKLNSSFKVEVTSTFKHKLKGVAIDIVLSKKKNVSSSKYASYSPNYSDGVLLKGGREIIDIPPNGKVTVKLNGSNMIPKDTPLGHYYLAAVVDAGNKIKEANERNNVSYCKIRIRGKIVVRPAKFPNLKITKIYLDKNCNVVVEVKNSGKGKLPDSVWTKHTPKSAGVYLYKNGQGWGGASIWKFDPGKKLQNPGGTAIYVSNLKVKNKAKIKATVDLWNKVLESNEKDNSKTKTLTCLKVKKIPPIVVGKVVPLFPNLKITKIYLDKNCNVVVEVKNSGKGKLPDSVWTKHTPKSAGVYLYKNGQGWGGASIWKFDPGKKLQNPGGTAIYVSNLKVKNKAKIKATVDLWNKVLESNEKDNSKTKTLTCLKLKKVPPLGKGGMGIVVPKEMPDLIVSNIRLVNRCKIEVTLKNKGKGKLPDLAYTNNGVSIQMYKDDKPWGGIILNGVDPQKRLQKPNGMITFLWFPNAENLKLTKGTHKIRLVVDITNKVVESNENNNEKIKTLICKGAGFSNIPKTQVGENIKTPKEMPAKPRKVTPREQLENVGGF